MSRPRTGIAPACPAPRFDGLPDRPDPAAGRRGSGRGAATSAPPWVTPLAVAVGPAVYAAGAWGRRWMSDDGFINLRVVEHLWAGDGPVYNAGERVEAVTSTLWLALLATARGVVPVPLEWVAVVLGLALAVAGALAGAVGARELPGRRDGALLPLGVVVVAGFPPFWDFATAGLEGGLGYAWLGATFWALAAARRRHRLGWWAWVLAGLGPLVRPDFAVYSAAFLVAGLVVERTGWRRRLAGLAVAAALPVAYQVFRMGYFAALAPTPALTKEAGTARWEPGWRYLADLVGAAYHLWVPLAAVAALGVGAAAPRRRRRCGAGVVRVTPARAANARWDGAAAAVVLAPLVGAAVHALYVVRVGGDFMYARLLLPALFAALLPVAVVRARPATVAAAGMVAAWALLAAFGLDGFETRFDAAGNALVVDERAFYVGSADHPHPVTVEDHDASPWVRRAVIARRLAASDADVVILDQRGFVGPDRRRPTRPGNPPVVAAVLNVGVFGYAAGPDVHVVDLRGLADPIAARLPLDERGRPGHEKVLGLEWVVSRFVAGPVPPQDLAARRALGCGALDRLLDAVASPLGPDRFLANLVAAPALHGLRIPGDPYRAEARFC